MFLFNEKFIGLVMKLFKRKSSGDIVGISVKIMLCGFEKVEVELEKNPFILPE